MFHAGNILKKWGEEELSFNEKLLVEKNGHKALKERKQFIYLVSRLTDKQLVNSIERNLDNL